jgi:5'-phosphate synthase pdxT subunit
MKTIGVLAFHGDVIEHIDTTVKAINILGLVATVISVRTLEELKMCDGLIIPGGESTTLAKLSQRENMWEYMKQIPAIFGTCAGAIMLAKQVLHKAPDQDTLECMHITVDRNAYGRQTESFEKNIKTNLGSINAVFIRAPRIKSIGKNVTLLAQDDHEILACEERVGNQYFLAAAFHPEMTSTLFHEHFLKQISGKA